MKINSEATLQQYINHDLKKLGIDFHHIERGRKAKNNHCKGIPDLMIFPGNGLVFFVELKWKTHTLRPEQEEFRIRFLDNGYRFYVVNSLEGWDGVKRIELTLLKC